jgi:CRP/FNR family cyclic AMP-dependent transcriptional regulator
MVRIACNPSFLRALPLFSPLTDAQFAAVLSTMQHRAYPARTRIVRPGEGADALFVVIAGRVRMLFQDGEGHELIADTMGPNEFFGEVGLIDAQPRAAVFETEGSCEILFIPRKTVLECAEQNPLAAMAMLRVVIDRLDEAHRRMATLALTDVYGRVANVLLESSCESEGEWHVQAGSEQIAAMVGASREMVSRVVKDMIRRGAVRRHKRKLIVVDRGSVGRGRVRTRHATGGALTGSAPAARV